MDKIAQFLIALNEIQEEYGMYIVTEYEEEMLISLDRTPNNHMIVCMTGESSINELNEDLMNFDPINLLKIDADDA